jgi:hypothetical protein
MLTRVHMLEENLCEAQKHRAPTVAGRGRSRRPDIGQRSVPINTTHKYANLSLPRFLYLYAAEGFTGAVQITVEVCRASRTSVGIYV